MTYTHKQIAALNAARTPGEWQWIGEDLIAVDGPKSRSVLYLEGVECGISRRTADAEFIAAAPDIVAHLLARVEALEALAVFICDNEANIPDSTDAAQELVCLAKGLHHD